MRFLILVICLVLIPAVSGFDSLKINADVQGKLVYYDYVYHIIAEEADEFYKEGVGFSVKADKYLRDAHQRLKAITAELE